MLQHEYFVIKLRNKKKLHLKSYQTILESKNINKVEIESDERAKNWRVLWDVIEIGIKKRIETTRQGLGRRGSLEQWILYFWGRWSLKMTGCLEL